MDRPTRLHWTVLAIGVVLVGGGIAAVVAYEYLTPARSTTPIPTVKTYENLTITYDAATGIANYSTPFISLVAHTLVVITITNYDPTASPLFVPWDNHVVGTVGDNESVNCGSGSQSITYLPSDGVSHTWTVLDAYYNISVPVPPARALGQPCTVTFELILNQAEMTTWGCVADCDNGQMAAGRMWGLLLIAG